MHEENERMRIAFNEDEQTGTSCQSQQLVMLAQLCMQSQHWMYHYTGGVGWCACMQYERVGESKKEREERREIPTFFDPPLPRRPFKLILNVKKKKELLTTVQ